METPNFYVSHFFLNHKSNLLIIFVIFFPPNSRFCSAVAEGILTDNPHLVLLFYLSQLFLRELIKSHRLIQVIRMDMSGYYGEFRNFLYLIKILLFIFLSSCSSFFCTLLLFSLWISFYLIQCFVRIKFIHYLVFRFHLFSPYQYSTLLTIIPYRNKGGQFYLFWS